MIERDVMAFATSTNAELVAMGVPRGIIGERRQRLTGQLQAVGPRWAGSIGMWGGVASASEIGEKVGVSRIEVGSYARSRGLLTATKQRRYTAAQLAVRCLARPGPAFEVGPELGLMAVEVVLYRHALSQLLLDYGVGFGELLGWSEATLEGAWAPLGQIFIAPSSARVDYSDREALGALLDDLEDTEAGEAVGSW